MQAHIKHLVTLIENVLSAITVVNVPIKYQNFLALIDSVLGSYSNVVEETKTSYFITMSMMARRAHNTVSTIVSRGHVSVIIQYLLDSGQAGLT